LQAPTPIWLDEQPPDDPEGLAAEEIGHESPRLWNDEGVYGDAGHSRLRGSPLGAAYRAVDDNAAHNNSAISTWLEPTDTRLVKQRTCAWSDARGNDEPRSSFAVPPELADDLDRREARLHLDIELEAAADWVNQIEYRIDVRGIPITPERETPRGWQQGN
jgi:hypothetical protein